MTITLTYDQAVASLHKAVEAKGRDYVYVQRHVETDLLVGVVAAYFDDDGKPSCIIGHVLADAGASYAVLQGHRLNYDTTVSELVECGFLEVDLRTELLLVHAQGQQDHNVPWGTAVLDAIRATREIPAVVGMTP